MWLSVMLLAFAATSYAQLVPLIEPLEEANLGTEFVELEYEDVEDLYKHEDNTLVNSGECSKI